MHRVNIIENDRVLREMKNDSEKKLKYANELILEQQNSCNHIGVYLGENNTDEICKCVLCGKALTFPEAMILANKNLMIYAQDYLKEVTSTQMAKYDTIQTMFLGISRSHKNETDEEIVERFNGMIRKTREVIDKNKEYVKK